jgi:hypothetical protein
MLRWALIDESGASQEGFYDVLLCLADFCPDIAVRDAASRLLDMLPTDQNVLNILKAAITSAKPADAMTPLLVPVSPGESPKPAVKPARLLYTLQVGPA